MTLNIFKALARRRDERRRLNELKLMAGNEQTLERLMEAGLLAWEPRQRRLLIMQPLAVVMMRTAESWQAFVRNTYLWTYSLQARQAWEDFFRREELAAVRRAQAALPEGRTLSRDDVERIRRARRQEIAATDMEPPRVEPFEMFILPDSTEAAPKPIAVGWFDPETDRQEIAPWSEVETLLKVNSEK